MAGHAFSLIRHVTCLEIYDESWSIVTQKSMADFLCHQLTFNSDNAPDGFSHETRGRPPLLDGRDDLAHALVRLSTRDVMRG